MGSPVIVTYARAEGADEARRLLGVLDRILGPGTAVLAGEAAVEDLERSEAVVALIGGGVAGALGEDLERAFAHRVPVIAMLMRKAAMPARDELPAALAPLLDNHPRLTLEMPSDFYWDVTTSHLGRWLARILEENRALERRRVAAAGAHERLVRERRQVLAELERAQADAAARAAAVSGAEGALAAAGEALEGRRQAAAPGRGGPGLRVFVSYRPQAGGDVRTLERDLRERLEGGRLESTEPIPPGADPAAVAAQRIERADVVLAVLGPGWLEGDGEADPVRLELEAALARGLPVLPVLVQHATMPAAERLPPGLGGLAALRGYELIVAFWRDGIDDLVERLEAIEGDLRRRDRELADALSAARRAERDHAAAVADEAKAQASIRALRERATGLEDEERRAREEAEALRHEHRDANAAFLAGPGEIALDRRERGEHGLAPSLRALPRGVLLAAGAVIVLVVIIVLATH